MGRGGKRGGGRGSGRGRGRSRGGGGGDNRTSYDNIKKTNDKLEKYYNAVLSLNDSEKSDFWAALRRELPNSFRFAGSKGHAFAVQRLLKEKYVPEIIKIEHWDGAKVEAPMPVPWYPDDLAWWMTTPKNIVRRYPPFAAFQKYLVSETSVGNISRQEVVSMIPPLLMDIEPGMIVLDMCAAPGSKAAQLLEMVHFGEEGRVRQTLRNYAKEDGREVSPLLDLTAEKWQEIDTGDYGRTTGLLIANDSDYKRSHMLIHQLKRLSSPNLIVTNHDATLFPSIKLPSTKEHPATNRYLKFDRILADVPCSGDGTCRKNPNLWMDWSPANALGLYVTQVRILVRALQMLKAGGRVVYSTCSMNPVENEAVVTSAIERCGGLQKVQLLDCSDRLTKLKRNPGLTQWTVMDKTGKVWSDWKSVLHHVEDCGSNPALERLVQGMFTPTGKDVEKIPLERCMRVYPHQQDTGGFFIAVLQKLTEFKSKPDTESKKTEAKSSSTTLAEEIDPMLPSLDGEDIVPKVESADLLSTPLLAQKCSVPLVAKQSEEGQEPESPISMKREREHDFDVLSATKKLKTREGAEGGPEPQVEDQKLHYTPPEDLRGNSSAASFNAQVSKNKRGGQQFEEPFKYIPISHPEVRNIEAFYNLSPRFPRDRFMVRNAMGDPAKTIYYTSALIRDIFVENEGKGIKFIHGGVRMFMKQDVQAEGVCRWRIQSEGMPILEGYVGEERIVRLYKKETLRKLLIEMFPKVDDGGWKNLGEIGERVRDISMGCCVLRIEPSNQEDAFNERMVLPLWRSLHSLNLMLAKEDRTAMLLRIFDDVTPLVNNHNLTKRVERPADLEIALGVKIEDGAIDIDIDEPDLEAEIESGSKSEIPADKEVVGSEGKYVKPVKIEKDEINDGHEA